VFTIQAERDHKFNLTDFGQLNHSLECKKGQILEGRPEKKQRPRFCSRILYYLLYWKNFFLHCLTQAIENKSVGLSWPSLWKLGKTRMMGLVTFGFSRVFHYCASAIDARQKD